MQQSQSKQQALLSQSFFNRKLEAVGMYVTEHPEKAQKTLLVAHYVKEVLAFCFVVTVFYLALLAL